MLLLYPGHVITFQRHITRDIITFLILFKFSGASSAKLLPLGGIALLLQQILFFFQDLSRVPVYDSSSLT